MLLTQDDVTCGKCQGGTFCVCGESPADSSDLVTKPQEKDPEPQGRRCDNLCFTVLIPIKNLMR